MRASPTRRPARTIATMPAATTRAGRPANGSPGRGTRLRAAGRKVHAAELAFADAVRARDTAIAERLAAGGHAASVRAIARELGIKSSQAHRVIQRVRGTR